MSERRRRWIARLAALPAIALMLAATAFVLREGLSDVTAIQANQRIAAWERGGPLTRAQAESVEATLRRAIALSPGNGDLYESLGTLYFARAVAPGRTMDGRLADFDRAVEFYRDATRRSTVSGYAWGNLMLAKHFAGQIDEEFPRSLRLAARYAPHEAGVQLMVLGAVLPRWTQLDTEARVIAATMLGNGWDDRREMLVIEAASAANRDIWCGADTMLPRPELVTSMRRLCDALAKQPVSPPERAARRAP